VCACVCGGKGVRCHSKKTIRCTYQ